MSSKETIACLFCQAANPPTNATCAACGQSLAAARTVRYLDRAEADIAKGQYNQARANLTKADVVMLDLSSEQRKSLLLTARAFYLHSLIYYHKGQTDEAKDELLLALQNLEDQPSHANLLANVLNTLGNVEYYREHLNAAFDYYQRSSEVAIKGKAHLVAAKAIANLGNISGAQGNPDASLAYYDRALVAAELGNDPLRVADIYRLIAYVYLKNGPVSKALEYVTQAVALRDQIDNQAALCRVLGDAGNVYLKCGELDQAAPYLSEAYEIAQRAEYRLMQVVTMMYLAELAHQRGDNATWLNYSVRAFNMTSSVVVWRSEAALQLVEYYVGQQDWQPAHLYLKYIEDNVRLHPTESDRIHLSHAKVLLNAALDQWDEATQSYEEAISRLDQTHDRFSAAALHQQYAAMLLRQAALTHDPTVHARARAVLEQAAAAYRQLGLTARLTDVESLLNRQQSNLLNRLKRIKHPQTALWCDTSYTN